MPMKDYPIRRKLMLIVLLTSVVVMLLMRGTFLTYEFFALRHRLEQQVATLGEVLAANSSAALAFQNEEDAMAVLASLQSMPNVTIAALYDQEGTPFAHFPAGLSAATLPAAPEEPGRRFSGPLLRVFEPVTHNDAVLGTLFLTFDTSPIVSAWLWSSLQLGLVVMALVFLIAYTIARVLQKQISAPILALADTARAVSEHNDYAVRAAKLGNDETGMLTDAFNQMLAHIQTQNEELREFNQSLEQRVRDRTAALEEANRELEAFSYSVSHDLRAPLRHIQGYADMLARATNGHLPEKAQRYLGVITAASTDMGQLIDDLLSFSRMGRAEMHEDAVDLNHLLAQLRDSETPAANGRTITWIIPPLPAVRADPAMLRVALTNLVSNAVKFTRTRETARIEIGCARPAEGGQQVVFFVRDNGVGFDMAYQEKLFGVFQRLHGQDEFEGTGIGLANVRRVITRHGGRVWAESTQGQGATFYFTLSPAETTRSVSLNR